MAKTKNLGDWKALNFAIHNLLQDLTVAQQSRIEEIEDEFELYKQCRQMEKLIDELARGRKMEKILRDDKK